MDKQLNMANPAPLGLLGFGMTTILLNLHNAGAFPLEGMILAMGIFYGGIAQIIAGILEWKKENTFGMTAFLSYGFFWLSLVAIIVMPKLGWVSASSSLAMSAYLGIWGLFTLVMFIATLKLSNSLKVVFGTLTILFVLLALGDLTGNHTITKIAGFEGLLCGFSAFYAAAAQIINGTYKKDILPL
jgi:succinate-acetate transporter protein